MFPDSFELEITQQDIDNGEPMNCMQCAVAQALRRVFPQTQCSVGSSSSMHIVAKGSWQKYTAFQQGSENWRDLQRFIDNFDNGFVVMPQKFTLYKDGGSAFEEAA